MGSDHLFFVRAATMRNLLAGLKRWWLRRFRGYVAAPARSGGTSWQQWPSWRSTFPCKCGYQGDFTPDTYVIREQDHVDGCYGTTDVSTGNPGRETSRVMDLVPCSCPVTDARYVKICPQCRMGHWKEAV